MVVSLDSKLDFTVYELKIKRQNKILILLRRLSVCLPRKALITIYKSFVTLHLDYGNILFCKPGNQNFESKIVKIQYKVCITITGGIQGASRKILNDELGSISLKEGRG